jgi:hypothetical protein
MFWIRVGFGALLDFGIRFGRPRIELSRRIRDGRGAWRQRRCRRDERSGGSTRRLKHRLTGAQPLEDNMAEKEDVAIGAPTPPESSRQEDVPAPDQRLQRCLAGQHQSQKSQILWMTAHNEPVVLAQTTYCSVCGNVLAEP